MTYNVFGGTLNLTRPNPTHPRLSIPLSAAASAANVVTAYKIILLSVLLLAPVC